jgi:ABC-2 type transport system permease protein
MKILRLINFELKKLLNIKKIIVILLIILGSSFGIIKFSEFLYNRNLPDEYARIDTDRLLAKAESTRKQLEEEYKNNPSVDNLYRLKSYEMTIENNKYMWSLDLKVNDWKDNVYNKISNLKNSKIPLNMYLDGVNMKELSAIEFNIESKEAAKKAIEEIDKQIEKLQNIIDNGYYYDYIKLEVENEKESLKTLENDIKLIEKNAKLPNYNAISRLHQLTARKNVLAETIKIYNYIIDNEIKDQTDWRYLICNELPNTLYYKYTILDTEEEFKYSSNFGSIYLTYEEYYNASKKLIDEDVNRNKEYWYYLDNNIKPLTFQNKMLMTPYSARQAMNNSYFMAIVSLIITAILCGGIVASEHKNGTIRLLLTKPYKRYKILLSKLIVMIGTFLIVYLLGILSTYLLGGIMYGFDNYNIPLVFNNSGVITEVPYLLFTLKNTLYEVVISLLFLVILFGLSSITLLSTISVVIVLVLIFVSFGLSYIIYFNQIFTYIPLVLLNFYEVLYNPNNHFININVGSSVLVAITYILVILFITFITYCKRDIKN